MSLSLLEIFNDVLSEAEGNKSSNEMTDDLRKQHEKVADLLDDPKIDVAGVMREVWGIPDGKDTASDRSLFRKKLNMLQGMHFDEGELNAIVKSVNSIGK